MRVGMDSNHHQQQNHMVSKSSARDAARATAQAPYHSLGFKRFPGAPVQATGSQAASPKAHHLEWLSWSSGILTTS